MKKERESERMKKFIKKIAIAVLAGTITFSIVPATVQAAGWKQNKNGYWWQENDYSYPKNQWKTIYGKQYHFNSKGYMDTDWTKVDGKWYYFGGKNDGAKKTYWQKVRGKYYWLGRDGVMRTGWQNVYGKYYWLGGSNDGAMKTGWQKVGGKYYLLGNNGDMKSGWQTVYRKKYYLGGANDGSMKTGWQQIGGYWYYFGGVNDGSLKVDTWVNGYYVDKTGKRQDKIELESYLYSYAKMRSLVGGSAEPKTFEWNEIMHNSSDGIWYATSSSKVEGVSLEKVSKYSIFGTFIGQNQSELQKLLSSKNWKVIRNSTWDNVASMEYRKNKYCLYIMINNNQVVSILFNEVYEAKSQQILEEENGVVEDMPLEESQETNDFNESEDSNTNEETNLSEMQKETDMGESKENQMVSEEVQGETLEEIQQTEENKEENME